MSTDETSLAGRLQIFIAELQGMSDEELFQTFRLIERGRGFASPGASEGESEDLALKEREAELEICRRHPDVQMQTYADWAAGRPD